MSKRVTPQEVEQMYQLYSELGTYAGVGKRMGRDPKTVARYIKAAGLKPLRITLAKKIVVDD